MLVCVQMVLNGAKKYHSEFFAVLGDLLSVCAVSIAACPEICLFSFLIELQTHGVQHTMCLFTAVCNPVRVVQNRKLVSSLLPGSSCTLAQGCMCILSHQQGHCPV